MEPPILNRGTRAAVELIPSYDADTGRFYAISNRGELLAFSVEG